MTTIRLAHGDQRPASNLDGIHLTAIDTDPDENLALMLANSRRPPHGTPIQVLGVIPLLFHGDRFGYLVVTYDRTKDPRASGDEAGQ
jgi:hypothetical protein